MFARVLIPFGIVLLVVVLTACQQYRVEYRSRPDYFSRMSDQPLADRVVLDDGTIILYNAKPGDDPLAEPVKRRGFQLREDVEDGSVRLNAVLPEHVVANTLDCIRRQEYQLLWDQMLAERTKLTYAERGLGPEDFAEFCAEHRIELARMLNRMLLGFASYEVVVENVAPGTIECSFWPQVAQLFKFKTVTITNEGLQLKLMMIN